MVLAVKELVKILLAYKTDTEIIRGILERNPSKFGIEINGTIEEANSAGSIKLLM
jgi:hypothetical protein